MNFQFSSAVVVVAVLSTSSKHEKKKLITEQMKMNKRIRMCNTGGFSFEESPDKSGRHFSVCQIDDIELTMAF